MAVWAPSTDVLCGPLPALPFTDRLCFPGGFCIDRVPVMTNYVPSASDALMELMGQLGPAMSGLAPIFNIVDAILAVFRCFEGVIDFSTSLDPTTLIECVPELVEKINNLLSLIPQMSIPRLARDLVRSVAQLLRAVANDLREVQQQLAALSAAIDDAQDLGDVSLLGFLACAEQTVQDQALSLAEALKGIGRIILLINLLLSLFGGPEIPCFGALLEDLDQLDTIIEALTKLANLLEWIADMIPDPQIAITIALKGQEC